MCQPEQRWNDPHFGLSWKICTEWKNGQSSLRCIGAFSWRSQCCLWFPSVPFFFFFFSVFCRINCFQETTGQEVKEDGISSWEVWFPQVRRCGGSSQEALSAHGDHHTLWIPSVQSIWESHSGAGQDSISFQDIPIRWTPARNWELAKNCTH